MCNTSGFLMQVVEPHVKAVVDGWVATGLVPEHVAPDEQDILLEKAMAYAHKLFVEGYELASIADALKFKFPAIEGVMIVDGEPRLLPF